MAVNVAAAIAAAESKIGLPYVWGATGPKSFDCSGLMLWSWRKAGVELPRTSQQQANYGTPVPLAKIQPGDLVTSNWGDGPSSHVGMYVGNGRIINAPKPGGVVSYSKLNDYYKSHINTVRRVPGAGAVSQADLPGPLGGAIAGGAELLGGSLLTPLRAMGGALGSMAASLGGIGQLATFLLRLALPSTWVRIMCGILGSLILFLGLGFLVREARGGG